ncbi:arsenical-resistance protein [Phytophthora cinnamomi]|uniref:arsenical-resistance protein n=1 Tax=Phytophthora cinnamomi TaxID=4785 RepID=UPI003559DA63|nr:arsenical-resistance protein [Phytophthora cinnamomi]
MVQNWVLGPFVMVFLSSAFFSGDIGYMTGLSLVGCACCIAMVVVWNRLAGGDAEYCAAIVAVNSVLTIGLYSPSAGLYINDLPSHLGIDSSAEIYVAMGEVAKNVGIYMGAPFVAALLTWYALTKAKGATWYFDKFTPRIGVLTLMVLLFTIIVLFASQSTRIPSNLNKVIYAAVPLLIYFMFMFVVSFLMSWWLGATYDQAVTLSFTAASNNFELALAVTIASFGLKSDPAQMRVVDAFIEIPTMLALVYLAFWFRPESIRYSQVFGPPAREALECVEASATAVRVGFVLCSFCRKGETAACVVELDVGSAAVVVAAALDSYEQRRAWMRSATYGYIPKKSYCPSPL